MARAFRLRLSLTSVKQINGFKWSYIDAKLALGIDMPSSFWGAIDGFKGSHALRKAILSIRSFQRYIHWSGFQLTGRDVQFVVAEDSAGEEMWRKMHGPTDCVPQTGTSEGS